MKIAIYSCHSFERSYIEKANSEDHELVWVEESLSVKTVDRASGCRAISIFSSDTVNREVLKKLDSLGVCFVTTRSAGTDHIDLRAAEELGIYVANIPEYSPSAIAEHCIALALALYRKLKTSFERIGNYNFNLDGQVGREINASVFGICGTGDIGLALANIVHGFGAKLLLFDVEKNPKLSKVSWANYVDKEELLSKADIVSLNLPLNEETYEFISDKELKAMKDSAILINTGRGGLVNTEAIFSALKDKTLAGFGMDVYENEKGIFYKDLSNKRHRDKLLLSLIQMENVVVTAHQAFLTETALTNMMRTTFRNLKEFFEGEMVKNKVKDI